jgi:GcrA cell cycle regulator
MPSSRARPGLDAATKAEIARLWEEGPSTSEIARRLGITKNTVIGVVHRMGLEPRVVRMKPEQPKAEFPGSGKCCWPSGHPGEAEFHFCGAPADPGSPYCPRHHAQAYVPAGQVKRVLKRIDFAAGRAGPGREAAD